jgi:hypothetical protein
MKSNELVILHRYCRAASARWVSRRGAAAEAALGGWRCGGGGGAAGSSTRDQHRRERRVNNESAAVAPVGWIAPARRPFAFQRRHTREGRGGFLAVIGVAAIAGCAMGAGEVDYPPERGISADIGAAHQSSPQLLQRGQIEHDEPSDAFPWQLDEGHQTPR